MSNALTVNQSRAVLKKGSRSFHFASLFLPKSSRDAAARVYAFCRLVDDVADERASDREALLGLDALESQLVSGEATRPEVAGFLEVARRQSASPEGPMGSPLSSPIDAARELVAGVRSDVGVVEIQDDGQLLRYCYRVAGTVGLMMCGVLGVRDRRAAAFAIDLGVAMQLTNICRDVAEDEKNGRVYLPASRLRRASKSEVVEELLELAEHYYRSARAGLRFIPWRPRFAIFLASRVYREIGVQLAEREYDTEAGRTIVSTRRKLRVLVGAALSFFGILVARYVRHDADLHRALVGLPGADRGSPA